MSGEHVISKKIKVAVVIPTHWGYRMGGSQYQAKLLIEQLNKTAKTSITYFTARADGDRHFSDHEINCVGNTNALRRFGHFWDYFRLQKALRAYAPDVIYQRVGCAYTGIAAAFARRSGVPLIWHLASANDCSKAPAIGQLLGRPHALIESRLAKRGVVYADVIIAQSEDQARILHENFGRQADRVIRNFHPAPPATDKKNDRFTVVWIGNLKPLKRPELFLEIAGILEKVPEIDLVMVGQAYPSRALQRNFDEMSQRHTNVRYLGAVQQEDVNKILERSHLLVNTSKSEGFSNTFIQAWMRSVPVLTLGVNPDGLLRDSYRGCSHNSTAGVASTVEALASNPDMLADMGKRSRQYAIRTFSMKNAVELAALIIKTATDSCNKPPAKAKTLI